MPVYEYSCDGCGRRSERYVRKPRAAASVSCECGGRARRVFSVPSLQTDTNNPLRGIGATRRAAAARMASEGCVIASRHDFDVCERRARERRREMAREVRKTIREYNKLPEAVRRRDLAKADAEHAASLKKAVASPLQTGG